MNRFVSPLVSNILDMFRVLDRKVPSSLSVSELAKLTNRVLRNIHMHAGVAIKQPEMKQRLRYAVTKAVYGVDMNYSDEADWELYSKWASTANDKGVLLTLQLAKAARRALRSPFEGSFKYDREAALMEAYNEECREWMLLYNGSSYRHVGFGSRDVQTCRRLYAARLYTLKEEGLEPSVPLLKRAVLMTVIRKRPQFIFLDEPETKMKIEVTKPREPVEEPRPKTWLDADGMPPIAEIDWDAIAAAKRRGFPIAEEIEVPAHLLGVVETPPPDTDDEDEDDDDYDDDLLWGCATYSDFRGSYHINAPKLPCCPPAPTWRLVEPNHLMSWIRKPCSTITD